MAAKIKVKPIYWFVFFLILYNNLINFLPSTFHTKVYIWLNLGVLLLAWLYAQLYLNLDHNNIGFTKENLGKSLLAGLVFASVIILALIIVLKLKSLLISGTQTPNYKDLSNEAFWWRVFIRIPLGTAFFEETLFRGILYGYLIKKNSVKKTIIITSLLFAIWHITPTFKLLNMGFQIESATLITIFWFVGLIGGGIAGLIFAWIRYRFNNIAGCILAHALINSISSVVVYWVW